MVATGTGRHDFRALRKVLPPVMGSMLEHQVAGQTRLRVYLSGDTLTGDHLDAVHERFPDIDVAVMHLGGTRLLASTVTMDAPQGVDFLRRVRPRSAVPVHYDDYRVFKSPLRRSWKLPGVRTCHQWFDRSAVGKPLSCCDSQPGQVGCRS